MERYVASAAIAVLRRPLQQTFFVAAFAAMASMMPEAAGAFDRFTFETGISKMDVPANCGNIRSQDDGVSSRARCSMVQENGATAVYNLEEWVAMSPDGKKTPDITAGLELVLRDNFSNFIKDSIRDSPTHNASAARLTKSQLPAGFAHCKKYTMNQARSKASIHEVGIFCAVWSARDQAILVTIGSVAEVCMKDTCTGQTGDFDRKAMRYLDTFRGL